MVLGFNFSVGDAVRSAADAFRNETLAKIPGVPSAAALFRRIQARKNLTGPKQASNTVDEGEFYRAKNKIESEIGGSLNPFKGMWNILQSVLGNTKDERIVAAIKNFESYAHQYEGYRFMHKAQEFLFTELERRVSNIESYGSKFVGTTNQKVVDDPVLSALKSAMKSWLEPFNRIAHGEVKEIAKLREVPDLKLLMNIRDNIRYSSKARYIKDLLPEYERTIQDVRASIYKSTPLIDPQHRQAGPQLAREMGV